MTRSHSFFTLGTALLAFAAAAQASTYGDNLLGVGPSARSLAGNGSAAPQDALAALTGNPAGLDGLPAGGAELDVAATFFLPHVTAQVGALTASSASKTAIAEAMDLWASPSGRMTVAAWRPSRPCSPRSAWR